MLSSRLLWSLCFSTYIIVEHLVYILGIYGHQFCLLQQLGVLQIFSEFVSGVRLLSSCYFSQRYLFLASCLPRVVFVSTWHLFCTLTNLAAFFMILIKFVFISMASASMVSCVPVSLSDNLFLFSLGSGVGFTTFGTAPVDLVGL